MALYWSCDWESSLSTCKSTYGVQLSQPVSIKAILSVSSTSLYKLTLVVVIGLVNFFLHSYIKIAMRSFDFVALRSRGQA